MWQQILTMVMDKARQNRLDRESQLDRQRQQNNNLGWAKAFQTLDQIGNNQRQQQPANPNNPQFYQQQPANPNNPQLSRPMGWDSLGDSQWQL